MITIRNRRGRISIQLTAVPMGGDLCVLIAGGDTPHIGAVTATSRTMPAETIVFDTHKEFHVTKMTAEFLRERLNRNIVVCCGIHLDDITKDEIADVLNLSMELLEDLCTRLSAGGEAL